MLWKRLAYIIENAFFDLPHVWFVEDGAHLLRRRSFLLFLLSPNEWWAILMGFFTVVVQFLDRRYFLIVSLLLILVFMIYLWPMAGLSELQFGGYWYCIDILPLRPTVLWFSFSLWTQSHLFDQYVRPSEEIKRSFFSPYIQLAAMLPCQSFIGVLDLFGTGWTGNGVFMLGLSGGAVAVSIG